MRRKLKLPVYILFLFLALLTVYGLLTSANYPQADAPAKTEENLTGTKVSKEEFVERVAPAAQKVQAAYGIRASIIIAQSTLESNFGQSKLASKYNNLFGVKSFGKEKRVKLETKEYVDGKWITIKDYFVWYKSWDDSIFSHAQLMRDGVDWDKDKYEQVISADNYKDAAEALQEAGYATDPTYADKLIEVIEQYKLYEYDK